MAGSLAVGVHVFSLRLDRLMEPAIQRTGGDALDGIWTSRVLLQPAGPRLGPPKFPRLSMAIDAADQRRACDWSLVNPRGTKTIRCLSRGRDDSVHFWFVHTKCAGANLETCDCFTMVHARRTDDQSLAYR